MCNRIEDRCIESKFAGRGTRCAVVPLRTLRTRQIHRAPTRPLGRRMVQRHAFGVHEQKMRATELLNQDTHRH